MDQNLLRILGGGARPAGEHYRSNPRHETEATAQLCWIEAGSRHRVRLHLRDISRLGACGTTRAEVPVGRRLQLRLIAPEPTAWIEAVVLAVDRLDATWRKLRIRFDEACPDVFLKAAVLTGVLTEPDESY